MSLLVRIFKRANLQKVFCLWVLFTSFYIVFLFQIEQNLVVTFDLNSRNESGRKLWSIQDIIQQGNSLWQFLKIELSEMRWVLSFMKETNELNISFKKKRHKVKISRIRSSHEKFVERIENNFIRGCYMENPLLINNLKRHRLSRKNKTIRRIYRRTNLDSTVWNLSGSKLNGVFIEIGAGNGQRRSRTAWLEAAKNWSGLLIEADPLLKEFLSWSGRKADIYPTCVGLGKYSYTGAFGWLPNYQSRLLDEEWAILETIEDVCCYPLYTYILAAKYRHIDLISLDINGNEIKVLKTIPWKKISINIILVRYLNNDSREQLIQYLTKYSPVRYEVKNDV
ncbi:uncharacterized protein LOC106661002 [Cimex lectularius]|uniref:Methyltransferase FkbM domain-containing protein n=1 Tax=Cimex lectularius TaxID=79782 RepID=A0A8I6R671_CIMLE|nr:uncharacterized protein LOC106661002 [Cimex lectularius]